MPRLRTNVNDQNELRRTLAALQFAVTTLNSTGARIAYGQHTTVTASDTKATGLTSVVACIANLDSDPILACAWATAKKDTGGNILIKTWKPTGAGDTTPIAATTFGKVVSWAAIGT